MPRLEKSFASSEKAKYWSIKNTEIPRNMFKSSSKFFWFDCNSCSHEFEASLHSITNGRWCSYCSNTKLCENKTCNVCFQKSFASSEKAKYWSIKNTETPRNVFKSSRKNCWFDCNKCNHSFEKMLQFITNGCWCPYCSNTKLCENETCKMCFQKSFASSEKAKYWSIKNTETPRNVFKSSRKKCWFDCNNCNHSFDARLHSITKGTWCSYCFNRRLCENETCKMCFQKSFASSEKVKYWSIKNTEIPRNIFKSTNKKCWFNCDSCLHEFEAPLSDITKGGWCSKCKNKTELKVYNYLIWRYPSFEIIHQPSFDWCKNSRTKRALPFDILIKDVKIIIEIDGPQHFRQVSNWQCPKLTQINDEYKQKLALDNEYTIFRMNQHDVWLDIIDWKNLIQTFIGNEITI